MGPFPHKYRDELSNAHEQFDKLKTPERAKIMIQFDQQFVEAKKLVEAQTGWKREKVLWWFKTRNPLLGNISPAFMIARGRGEKLIQFIKGLADAD